MSRTRCRLLTPAGRDEHVGPGAATRPPTHDAAVSATDGDALGATHDDSCGPAEQPGPEGDAGSQGDP